MYEHRREEEYFTEVFFPRRCVELSFCAPLIGQHQSIGPQPAEAKRPCKRLASSPTLDQLALNSRSAARNHRSTASVRAAVTFRRTGRLNYLGEQRPPQSVSALAPRHSPFIYTPLGTDQGKGDLVGGTFRLLHTT